MDRYGPRKLYKSSRLIHQPRSTKKTRTPTADHSSGTYYYILLVRKSPPAMNRVTPRSACASHAALQRGDDGRAQVWPASSRKPWRMATRSRSQPRATGGIFDKRADVLIGIDPRDDAATSSAATGFKPDLPVRACGHERSRNVCVSKGRSVWQLHFHFFFRFVSA